MRELILSHMHNNLSGINKILTFSRSFQIIDQVNQTAKYVLTVLYEKITGELLGRGQEERERRDILEVGTRIIAHLNLLGADTSNFVEYLEVDNHILNKNVRQVNECEIPLLLGSDDAETLQSS